MWTITAYGYGGEFAFAVDFDTKDEAIAFANTIDREDYDLDLQDPAGNIYFVQ